jgi:structural maintenance of chromosome 3 (chondroitin sulfate proteoglycan 6)
MDRLEETTSKLKVLHAKQGRSRQFTTQAARDKFLADEIKSLKGYEKTQQKLVESLTSDVEGAKTQLEELLASSRQQAKEDADRRENLKQMGEEMTRLKGEVDGMQEQKKNLWREDGKLSQTVSNAKATMDEAQRALLGMMDKVS